MSTYDPFEGAPEQGQVEGAPEQGQVPDPFEGAPSQGESSNWEPQGGGATDWQPTGVDNFMARVQQMDQQFERKNKDVLFPKLPMKSAGKVIKDTLVDYVLSPTPPGLEGPKALPTERKISRFAEGKPLLTSPSQAAKGAVAGIGQGLGYLGGGLAQTLAPEGSSADVQIRKTMEARGKEYEALKTEAPGFAALGSGVGQVASGLVVPGGVTGLPAKVVAKIGPMLGPVASLGKRMLTGGLGGAAYTGALYDSTPKEVKLGGLLGMGAPVIGATVRQGKNIPFPGKGAGALKAAEDVTMAAQAKGALKGKGIIKTPALKAAEKEGIFLSPEEALKSKALVGELGTITPTPKIRYQAEELLSNRNIALVGKTKKIATDLVPEGTKADKVAASLFEEAKASPIPPQALDELKQVPEYMAAAATVQKANPGLDPNTVGFQHQVYRQLFFDSRQILRGGENVSVDAVGNILESRKALGEIMGLADIRIKKGIDLYKRMSIQNEILHTIKNVKAKKGLDTVDALQLRQILVGREESKEGLFRLINQAGGDPKQANNVIEILGALHHGSIINQLISKKTTAPSSPVGKVINKVQDLIGGSEKMQAGMAELLTNPKWAKDVSAIVATKNKAKSSDLLLRLLSRVGSDLSGGE